MQKKESFSIKMLNSKKYTLSKIPTTTKKEPCEILQKKFPKKIKKIFQKKIQKKISKKNWRKATKIFTLLNRGGEGRGHIPPQWSLRIYTDAIGKEMGIEIGTKIGSREQRAETQRYILLAYLPICLDWLIVVHWFIGSDFLPP